MTAEPRAISPRLVALYEAHREDTPVVTILCGAENGRCRKRLGKVWATPSGLLLHYVQHVAPKRFGVDTSALTDAQLADYLARDNTALRRYEAGQETGIAQGLKDDGGWLALVDDDSYWHPAEVGCMDHDGFVELDRDDLHGTALRAVRAGRHAEMRVRR